MAHKEIDRDALLTAVSEARSKSELMAACKAVQSALGPKQDVANLELLAQIAPLIAAQSNAKEGAVFPLPLTMRLLVMMHRAVGPRTYILLDAQSWAKVVGNPEAVICIDPAAKVTDVLAGYVGVMYGIKIYTDAYYDKEMRVLPDNTVTVMSEDGSTGLYVTLD